VTGHLERPNGSPAVGVEVYIFPFKDAKMFHGMEFKGGKFGLSNPGDITDSRGRFTIKFSQDYLQEHGAEDFIVGSFEWATPTHPTGRPLPLTLSERAQAILTLTESRII